jgi:hypothetical protein
MPTIDALKTFLIGEYQQGLLPSDPSFLFSREFLEHLVAFIDRHDHVPCPRCDAVVEGLSRQVEVMQCWLRSLRGGAR